MIVLLPIVFSVLLTIGLMVAIMIGTWFYRSFYLKATFIIAVLLGISGVILGVESFTFLSDLQGYASANELFVGRLLTLSAAIPAIVSCVGSVTLIVNTTQRHWSYRQTVQSRFREVAEV